MLCSAISWPFILWSNFFLKKYDFEAENYNHKVQTIVQYTLLIAMGSRSQTMERSRKSSDHDWTPDFWEFVEK